MMKRSLLVLLLGSLPATAQAQEDGGLYLAASATLATLQDTEGTIANAPVPGSTVRTENSFGSGAGGQVAVGYDFGSFRLEVEGGYARNKQDDYVAIVPPTGRMNADVKHTAFRLMVNGYYDLLDGPVRPYVGGGAGVAKVELDFFGPRAPFPTEAPRQLIKDSDRSFAYQLIAGVAVPVGGSAAVTLQYRWFDAGTIKPVDIRNEIVTRKHRGHNIDLGVRIGF